MPIHFTVKFVQQKSPLQIQHLILSIHMKFIYVQFIRRCHPDVITGKLRRLLSTLYVRPAIHSLHKVIRRLSLVLFNLKTGYVCCQPVYQCIHAMGSTPTVMNPDKPKIP